MTCHDCGDEMTQSEVPKQWDVSIPFTNLSLKVLLFGSNHHEWVCVSCATGDDQMYMDRVAEGAYDDGFEAGYKRAERDYA